jgi:predicted nucleic acid-binding protein
MKKVLVDSNIILDIFTEDPKWFDWSANQLEQLAEHHILAINPIIYAEVSVRFDKIEDLEEALPSSQFSRFPLSWESAFLAGKVFKEYKGNGGKKSSTMPDFFIGAHALIEGMLLLTRDVSRYKMYFPKLELIAPC